MTSEHIKKIRGLLVALSLFEQRQTKETKKTIENLLVDLMEVVIDYVISYKVDHGQIVKLIKERLAITEKELEENEN